MDGVETRVSGDFAAGVIAPGDCVVLAGTNIDCDSVPRAGTAPTPCSIGTRLFTRVAPIGRSDDEVPRPPLLACPARAPRRSHGAPVLADWYEWPDGRSAVFPLRRVAR